MKHVYELTCENTAMAAGGPMGSPSETMASWLCDSMDKAKRKAKSHFILTTGRQEAIKWRGGQANASSQDLGDRMYFIQRRDVL